MFCLVRTIGPTSPYFQSGRHHNENQRFTRDHGNSSDCCRARPGGRRRPGHPSAGCSDAGDIGVQVVGRDTDPDGVAFIGCSPAADVDVYLPLYDVLAGKGPYPTVGEAGLAVVQSLEIQSGSVIAGRTWLRGPVHAPAWRDANLSGPCRRQRRQGHECPSCTDVDAAANRFPRQRLRRKLPYGQQTVHGVRDIHVPALLRAGGSYGKPRSPLRTLRKLRRLAGSVSGRHRWQARGCCHRR